MGVPVIVLGRHENYEETITALTCEKCGAPLRNNKCEYCGTEYKIEAKDESEAKNDHRFTWQHR